MPSNARQPIAAGLAPVATATLWLTFFTIGIAGLILRYPRPSKLPAEPSPVALQSIAVDIHQPVAPAPAAVPLVAPADQSPAAPSAAPAPAPAPAVAAPKAAIPFAVPVAWPVRSAMVAQAAPPTAVSPSPAQTNAAAPSSVSPAVPQRLTLGQGEGRQPAPEYPREAVLNHEQGTVIVRFTVDAKGHVQDAEASVPCASALLNQAAVRTVREEWRFSPGPIRNYEVPFQFELHSR